MFGTHDPKTSKPILSDERGRRQFLRGAGGFSLALPFLPSLMPRSAWGAEPTRRKHFVAMATDQGAIKGTNMFPSTSALPNRTTLFTGHTAGWGPLAANANGSDAVISPVLTAPNNRLTPSVVSKLNVILGLNVPFGIAHHTGGHLGNYARNDGNGDGGRKVQAFPMPTIDQVMAWSPSFYPSSGSVKERTMITGSRGGFSYSWSNPQSKSGSVQEVGRTVSARSLFDKIFVPNAPVTPAKPPRASIVDRVLTNYKNLRSGDRRLSAADRQRLDDHIARLAELDRKTAATAGPVSQSCGNQQKPAQDGSGVAKFQAMNDVFVAAFVCGSSRIGVMSLTDVLTPSSGSWHQETAHKWQDPAAQERLVKHYRNVFAQVFLDLATKLDAVDMGGHTLLDDTLIAWSQESGASTHDPVNMPVITAGAAAGAMKTGLLVDYRNTTPKAEYPYVRGEGLYAGLTWNRWLGTVLDAMGVPRSEFETPSMKGYGHNYVENVYKNMHVAGSIESANQPLPFIMA